MALQLGYRTMEELFIIKWTAFLFWLAQRPSKPCINEDDIIVYDYMTNGDYVFAVFVVTLILVIVSQLLPMYSQKHGGMVVHAPFPANMPLSERLQKTLEQKFTVMEVIRTLLSMLLPLLGVMVTLNPKSMGALFILKKMLLLEGKLWKQWCPEGYIIFFSICCTLLVARRSVFIQRYRPHDRFKKESNANFFSPSPAYNYGMA